MKKLASYLSDIVIAVLLGFSIGLLLLVVLYIIGFLFGGAYNGLVVVRSGLLMVGGFSMVFSAGLILKGGHLPKSAFKFRIKGNEEDKEDSSIENDELNAKLKKIFHRLNRNYVALFFASGILLLAGMVDYFMWLTK